MTDTGGLFDRIAEHSTLTTAEILTLIQAEGDNAPTAAVFAQAVKNRLGIPVAKYCETLAAVEYAATACIEEGDL